MMMLRSGNCSDYSDLSIVLQGPAELEGAETAALAAKSARSAFPGAEVVLSCWVGDKVDAVSAFVDHLVTSPDPGPQRHAGGMLNVNRQIVSSRAGFNASTRPYVLKARSDIVFRDARLWSEYCRQSARFQAIHEREPILITNLTTVNPLRHERYLTLCDWIYLGPRAAMAELLATPPYPEEYLTYNLAGNAVLRFNAEQWIAINFLASHGLDLNSLHDGHTADQTVARAHNELLGQHFVLSSWFRLGLSTLKHRLSSFSLDIMYTDREWSKQFLKRHSAWDPERIALTMAYHPMIRQTARLLTKIRIA